MKKIILGMCVIGSSIFACDKSKDECMVSLIERTIVTGTAVNKMFEASKNEKFDDVRQLLFLSKMGAETMKVKAIHNLKEHNLSDEEREECNKAIRDSEKLLLFLDYVEHGE